MQSHARVVDMGADIYGWVEVRPPESEEWEAVVKIDHWEAVVKIDHLVPRSYGMFASLFGIRNADRFRPVAAARGMPPNPSEEFFAEHADYGGGVGTTWILWSELTTVDWDEEEDPAAEYDEGQAPDPLLRRADFIIGGWASLFDLMEVLAGDYGPENVRLSVWFDQP